MMTSQLLPAPMKETRPADEVITAFLSLRQASHEQVILSQSSIAPLARARHELMWLLRDLTHMTLTEIGVAIGGRDPTTVRHGIDRVADRIATNEPFRREMLFLRTKILQVTGAKGLPPDLCLTAVRSILSNGALSDADARQAAVQMIEARHG